MGLKATLTALINANIRNKTPKVIKVEHADVEQALLNEIYPTPVSETSAADGNFHHEYANVTYDITSWKQGRLATAIVEFKNDGTTANNVVLATIVNSEFIPNGIYKFHITATNGASATIQVSSAGIRLLNSMITQSNVPFRGILSWPVNA